MASSSGRFRLSTAHVVVLVVLVLLSCGGAVAAALAVPARYSATAKLVLIGPNVSATGQASNPFVDFSGGLNTTADVLALSSMTAQNADSVVAAGGTRTYTTVSSGAASSEPILTITSQAPTKVQAIWTAKLLTVRMQADLASRQTTANVPANLRVTMVSVTTPDQASRQLKTAAEVGIAVLVAGLVVSIGLVLLLDRRRKRLIAKNATSVQTPGGPVMDDDAVSGAYAPLIADGPVNVPVNVPVNGRDVAVSADGPISGPVNGKDVPVIADGPINVPVNGPVNGQVNGSDVPVITDDAAADSADASVAEGSTAGVAADTRSPRRRRVRMRAQDSAAAPATNGVNGANGANGANGSAVEANGTAQEVGAGDGSKRVADDVRSYRANNESANGARPDPESSDPESIDSDSSDEGRLDAAKATAAADGR